METLIPDGWFSCTICSTVFIGSESWSSVLRPMAAFLFDFDNIRGFGLGDPVAHAIGMTFGGISASKSRKLASCDFGNSRDLFVFADGASQKSPGKSKIVQ